MFFAPITVLILVVVISPATSNSITPSPTISGSTNAGGANTSSAAVRATKTTIIIDGSTTTIIKDGTTTIIHPTSTTGGGRASATTTASGGGVSPSPTQTTASSSSVVVNKEQGPLVSLNLTVTVNCSGGNLEKLKVSVLIDIRLVFTKAGFSIKTIVLIKITCNSPLNMVLGLSFYSPIPEGKTIQGVFEDALRNGSIRNLTMNNTEATFTFVGAKIKYKPKAGQCQKVCCDGGGGDMTVVPECTPTDKCEGIVLPSEKKENGHCPGDSIGTCTVECDGDGGIHNSPNFAVVILLAIATFVNFQ